MPSSGIRRGGRTELIGLDPVTSAVQVSRLAPVASSTLARLSVLGHRARPSGRRRLVGLHVVAVVHAASDPVERPPGPGPCRAEDVLRCLDGLYRQRRIDLLHARILRIWGFRGVAPNPARARERSDWRVWHEALDRLEGPLRAQ